MDLVTGSTMANFFFVYLSLTDGNTYASYILSESGFKILTLGQL